MLFNSAVFIFAFLPITLAIFYLLKHFKKFIAAKVFLILASFYFYGFFEPRLVFLLIFSILINYFIALKMLQNLTSLQGLKVHNIDRGGGGFALLNQNKFLIFLGIAFNLLLLGFFKYTDFFLENFNLFAKLAHLDFSVPLPHIILPLGISFFTFQQIAFLVDTYKGVSLSDLKENLKEISKEDSYPKPFERIDFLDYCLFISFFPQLIAGPIVHHKEMMPQFKHTLKLNAPLIVWDKFAKGIFIFIIGLFKKTIIADTFAKHASLGFDATLKGEVLSIAEAWGTSLSYTFQIYFDFSAYCDMAIGLGLLFGVVLPLNFHSPYKARNVAEFWRRWHITLGRFLKAYLYIPLGGNRAGKWLNIRNLFIVAFLSGVWHGAGWGFVIWGILHGLALVMHRFYEFFLEFLRSKGVKLDFLNSKIYYFFAWLLCFQFINLAWIFFRAESINSALSVIKSMFALNTWVELPEKFWRTKELFAAIDGDNAFLYFLIVAFIIVLCFKNSYQKMEIFKPSLRLAFILALLFVIALITMLGDSYSEFIYFNF